MADWNGFKKNGTTYIPNDSTARGWIGTLSNLATTVKTNIVAAINELVTNIASRVDWSSYAKTGVHQWFDISKYGVYLATATVTGNSVRVQGNGAWANVYYKFYDLPKNTDFRLISTIDFTSGAGLVNVKGKVTGGSDVTIRDDAVTEDMNYSAKFNTGNYDEITIGFYVCNTSVTTGDITFGDVLLKLENDTNVNVTPYAMTNEQLTDAVTLKTLTVESGSESVVLQNTYAYKVGNVICIRTQVQITDNISGNTRILSANVEHPYYGIACLGDTNTTTLYGLQVTHTLIDSVNKLVMTAKASIPAGWYALTYTYILS